MTENIVIIGAGGHAKVIIDLIRICNQFNIVGCIGKGIQNESLMDVPILGDDSRLIEIYTKGISNAFIAIGDNNLRKKLALEADRIGFNLINVISPNAYVSPVATLGKGIAIMPGAIINTEVRIGNNVIVNTSASIDHECILDDFAHIGPGSHLAGNVHISEGALLGVGCSVIPKVNIGEWSIVGAGSVVIKDLPVFSKSLGVPAKVIETNIKG